MKQLFSRFMDGDYRTIGSTGTGIGLSLTRDLVRKLKGTISVESTEGEGTTFTVVLPISREAGAKGASAEDVAKAAVKETVTTDGGEAEHSRWPMAMQPSPLMVLPWLLPILPWSLLPMRPPWQQPKANSGRPTPSSSSRTISTCSTLRQHSSDSGTTSSGPPTAGKLTVLERNAVDIVVTDVMMPVMGGIELTKKIKANADYAMMPVIMLTAKRARRRPRRGI